MGHGNFEVEIKLPVPDLLDTVGRITRLGWRQLTERTLEKNVLLDRQDQSLRGAGVVLRLRQYGSRSVITFKGPAGAGKHKVREELESAVGDCAVLQDIFLRLGFVPGFRYEKYRTEFTDGVGQLTVDETPIGNFLELEGPPEWIDECAAKLGYAEAEYITLSYGKLYAVYCERTGRPMDEMIFEQHGH